ncbi:adenosylmethionine--8-amino-7-oxononanoate transaminase [Roseiconus lacunae]|uniref:Adenosylmethionine-8-amino-7-oxononanoate aminotransferase n=1 Tax=Roseiconus lacunae TaxID=2605694 RepID=A0ABT7PPG6_9BACT|nr:adenosylmethionine--8-amino-7-oxononanoate transaminase [Roseiconus lacunae]MDM4018377.1 adenosylmethionine--8-amino-7-oxononanoate transaminase [Roseiconus lacunae]
MSDHPAWQIEGYDHLWMPYCQMKTAPLPLAVRSTSGVRLHLADGRTVIDSLASWWSACHGYNHPAVVDAIEQQLSLMPHVMFGGINHEPALRLARRLAAILPGDLNRVFFADSGSVALEVAMKMAIGFWRNHGQPGRTRFLAFHHAYHGDTTGAMSLCDPNRSMHASFGDGLLKQLHLDLPRDDVALAQLDQTLGHHRDELAAVVIEPLVQGAGGMRFHSPKVLRAIAETCRRNDVLLIADELATGFCRTGTMFAVQGTENQNLDKNNPATSGSAVIPDIICVGKALTAGMLPMAATIASDRVFDAFFSDDPSDALMHGPTFMANPLACAAANASLDLFENEPRLVQVREIERQLSDQLSVCRQIDRVVDVRVKGAIGVLQVDRLDHVDRLRQAFLDRGIWLRPFGDCIYTTPSLVISPDDLSQITTAMVEVTRQWASWN